MSEGLRKLLRRGPLTALEQALAGRARLEDHAGALVAGDAAATGDRYPIPGGALVGPADTAALVPLITELLAMERDRRALAVETLGRYKELSLLYELSEKLSSLLDLDAVASLLVQEARRHLHADAAALLLADARGVLRTVASTGDDRVDALASRVFATGRSDLVHGDRSVLCAPLRTGERVFGVVHVSQERVGQWTSGDLKLVAAVAANAAGAIANAQLHAERVRELALRHRVERHVSPRLLDAVFDGEPPSESVSVALCDLRGLAALEPTAPPERLLHLVETGIVAAVHAFLAHGAAIDTPQGELVVGVFRAEDDAVAGAERLVEALERRGMGGLAGVGVATVPAAQLASGINAAAVLQSESAGRVRIGGVA